MIATLPTHLLHQLQDYRDRHALPSLFLQSVLRGDLYGTVEHAEPGDLCVLPMVMAWLYDCIPFTLFGTDDAVDVWLAEGDAVPAVRSLVGV